MKKIELEILTDSLSICRLNEIPVSFPAKGLWSLTVTDGEISLVCPSQTAPADAGRQEKGWRAMRVVGTLDFSLVGILSPMLHALAEAGISVFALSTYDTDYLLVREKVLNHAVKVLLTKGYLIRQGQ